MPRRIRKADPLVAFSTRWPKSAQTAFKAEVEYRKRYLSFSRSEGEVLSEIFWLGLKEVQKMRRKQEGKPPVLAEASA